MTRTKFLGNMIASSESIINSISKVVPSINPEKLVELKFGDNLEIDTKIALNASITAKRPIPDNLLSQFKTIGDLVKFLTKEIPIEGGKGIPWVEIFKCSSLPPNVTLINYHKRKWSHTQYYSFLQKEISGVFSANI